MFAIPEFAAINGNIFIARRYEGAPTKWGAVAMQADGKVVALYPTNDPSIIMAHLPDSPEWIEVERDFTADDAAWIVKWAFRNLGCWPDASVFSPKFAKAD